MPTGFIRRYQITVLSPPSEGSSIKTVIRDNQISGSFHYNSTGTNVSPDLHKLIIYNPSPGNIVALRETGSKIKVQMGYQYESGLEIDYDNLNTVFRGEIVKSDIVRTNSDTQVKLELSQGYTELKSAHVKETFPAGTPFTDILVRFAKTTDLSASVRLGTGTDRVIATSQTYNGATSETLERFCNRYKLRWYLENETIYVVSVDDKGAARAEAPTFTEVANRVKGTTSWTVDDQTKIGGAKTTQVTLNLFLYSQIGLGDSITLTIEDAEVTVVVESIKHMVDYYGNQWDTRIIAKSTEDAKVDANTSSNLTTNVLLT